MYRVCEYERIASITVAVEGTQCWLSVRSSVSLRSETYEISYVVLSAAYVPHLSEALETLLLYTVCSCNDVLMMCRSCVAVGFYCYTQTHIWGRS